MINSKKSETKETTRDVVETYGALDGPLVGLTGTTDSRLGTITLIGEPQLITVAESYLKQLDLRKRQVAVKVQILNVRLENNATIDSSFSAKMGDAFIVSQSGKAHMNFGAYKPGSPAAGTGIYDGSEYYGLDLHLFCSQSAGSGQPSYATAKDRPRSVGNFDPVTGVLFPRNPNPDLLMIWAPFMPGRIQFHESCPAV